jgi:ArsR family transcriptional regulator
MFKKNNKQSELMAEDIYNLHANICKTFTSPVRLKIIDELRTGEKSVSELANVTGLNQPNISQHLAVLRNKKIVKTRKVGNITYYAIANRKIFEAFDIVLDVIFEQLSDNNDMALKLKETVEVE